MRIDELNPEKASRQRRIDLIRQIQEYQAKLDQADAKQTPRLDALSTSELLAELDRVVNRAEVEVKAAAEEQARSARGDGAAAGAASTTRPFSITITLSQ